MSKFVLTVKETLDSRIVVTGYDDCVYINLDENHGDNGWVHAEAVGPLSPTNLDTLIKRLKTAKDILEEEDDD